MRAQAAILRDPGKPFTVEDVSLAAPGPGEALVRVAGAGMCHTDALFRGRAELPMPMVFGHEGSGVVETVGPGVTRVAPGDHVVMSYDSCGWCGRCVTGAASYCDEFMARNLSGVRADGSAGATSTGPPRWRPSWTAARSRSTPTAAASAPTCPSAATSGAAWASRTAPGACTATPSSKSW